VSRPGDNPPRDFPVVPPGAAADNVRIDQLSEYNVPAIIGMCCGILGLVVFQIALAPAAIIFGAYGVHYAKRCIPGTQRLAVTAYVLGIVDGLVWLVLASVWHVSFFPL
jgi:hypothetical protein